MFLESTSMKEDKAIMVYTTVGLVALSVSIVLLVSFLLSQLETGTASLKLRSAVGEEVDKLAEQIKPLLLQIYEVMKKVLVIIAI